MSVYSVNVYPSCTTIETGKWYYGAYAIVNASSNCNTGVEWYSDSPSVATVNASSGYIYAKAPGTANIYAQSIVDSSKKDYITVNVTSDTIYVNSITLNRSSISLEKGDTFDLYATVCPTNATNKSICWSSTNPSVATVSSGVVTAKASGYAYIYAEAQDGSGEYARCYVNVTEDILVTSVTVSPSSKTMNIGSSAYLYETVCPANATNKCVAWSSNKTSVATVNPDTGLVIAQGTGTATITATAQDGSNKKGYCTITVNPPVAVTGVEVCPTSLTMNVGDIEYLCASITPSNATNQTVTWCSSNENVATVGLYTGKVTAKMAGTTTITATTDDGERTDICEIKVFIDTVMIEEDGLHNLVTFKSSNKIWKTVDRDIIYEPDEFYQVPKYRSLFNCYTNYDENDPINTDKTPRENSDDEIKLLYAIDPHGVAAYVWYRADYYFRECTNNDIALKNALEYKDRIFELLFKRKPKYYRKSPEGLWQPTEDRENLREIVSESESYFGVYNKRDDSEVLLNILDFVFSVLQTICPSEVGDMVIDAVGTLLKMSVLYYYEEYENAYTQASIYIAKQEYNASELFRTVFDYLGVFKSFNDLMNSLTTSPKYYCAIIDYCLKETNYDINLMLTNGQILKLFDINQHITL